MSRRRIFVAGLFFTFALGVPACGLLPASEDSSASQPICAAGGYVFCRCQDRTEGTKLCKDDGQSFEACTTGTNGICGEVPDPKTNQVVSAPGAGGKTSPTATTMPSPSSTSATVDACPGKSTAVLPNTELTLEGDTTTATGDRNGKAGACAVGVDGKDHVYHLIPSGSGTLEVKLQGQDPLVPLVYIRTTCEDADTQVACGPPVPGAAASVRLNVQTGKDYFLVVDAASGSAGTYSATLKLSTQAFCGDGQVDQNEACDDGNKTENDGCSNDCQHVDGNPATGGSCIGHAVDVWSGRTVHGNGSTNTYGNAWNAPSASCDGAGTNGYLDHVYAVTPHTKGNLVVSVAAAASGPLNDHMLSARRTCEDPTTMGADMCANTNGVGAGETMTFAVDANQTVWVAVDGGGEASNRGDYAITFALH